MNELRRVTAQEKYRRALICRQLRPGMGLGMGMEPRGSPPPPPTPGGLYLQPDGVSLYLRPDGTSLYNRP